MQIKYLEEQLTERILYSTAERELYKKKDN